MCCRPGAPQRYHAALALSMRKRAGRGLQQGVKRPFDAGRNGVRRETLDTWQLPRGGGEGTPSSAQISYIQLLEGGMRAAE
jgi:hypothetical protein